MTVFHLMLENNPVDQNLARALVKPVILEFFSALETNRILLALEEAIVNIFEHGYRNANGLIDLSVIKKTDSVVFTLEDRAELFDPTTISVNNPLNQLHRGADGGFGLYIIRNVMDVSHFPRDGGGNVLVMERKLFAGEKFHAAEGQWQ